MKIEADVHSINKLKDYFFVVPDYQREYIWKADDHVEQFLNDIEAEYEPGAKKQSSYFIGSIILVGNGAFEVIDGQQRLTTIVLTLCAFRDRLKEKITLTKRETEHRKKLDELLYEYDLETDRSRYRLELQYEDSHDYFKHRIDGNTYAGERTASIERMDAAYDTIVEHLNKLDDDELIDRLNYFLTCVELVVIKSEDLGSALKIFETINQRGAGLNAMDLVKNLIFRKAPEAEFNRIKVLWKELMKELDACQETDPLRFLRYFLMARYADELIREDGIYKWIISDKGKKALGYEKDALGFAKAMLSAAKRYSAWVLATESRSDTGAFPSIARIGLVNKIKSRLHLLPLLALDERLKAGDVEYLAAQLESYLFLAMILNIQAKYHERTFLSWVQDIRKLKTRKDLEQFAKGTMHGSIKGQHKEFSSQFLLLTIGDLSPGYRIKYVLGRLDSTLAVLAQQSPMSSTQYGEMDLEHMLPQTPKGALPAEFSSRDDYDSHVARLGNALLLEGTINKALNKVNDLGTDWFSKKCVEYVKSSAWGVKLMAHGFAVGKNTAINRARDHYGYEFKKWDKAAIAKHQEVLLQLAMDTWTIGGQRIDGKQPPK
ncbi:MAG: DUF262 domain-containing protein [Flavobacteriales bacterium]|nr:DUF262 domain-containing protein [Flavobacteriales bacterium]